MKLKILIVTLGYDAARARVQAESQPTTFKKRIRVATSVVEAEEIIRCWRPNFVMSRARLPKQARDLGSPRVSESDMLAPVSGPSAELAVSEKLHGFAKIWADCHLRSIAYVTILCDSGDHEALHFLDAIEEPIAAEDRMKTRGLTTYIQVPRPHSEGHQIQWGNALAALERQGIKEFKFERPNRHLLRAIQKLKKEKSKAPKKRSNKRKRRHR